MRKKSYL